MTNFKKYFTPQEARQTLPLVKSIVNDLLATGQRIRKFAEKQEEIKEDDPLLQPMLKKLNEYHTELEEIGCYFKDWSYEVGLVDFPAIIEGNEVFLCWRSDEVELEFYHEINEGYSGRKKIKA